MAGSQRPDLLVGVGCREGEGISGAHGVAVDFTFLSCAYISLAASHPWLIVVDSDKTVH